MALYFECRINKNALLQTVFVAILLTGFAFHSHLLITALYLSVSFYRVYGVYWAK